MTIRELKQLIAEFPDDNAKLVIPVMEGDTYYTELVKIEMKEVSNNRVMITFEQVITNGN